MNFTHRETYRRGWQPHPRILPHWAGFSGSHHGTPPPLAPNPADPSGVHAWREALRGVTLCISPTSAPRFPCTRRSHNWEPVTVLPTGLYVSCLCMRCALCQEAFLPLLSQDVKPPPVCEGRTRGQVLVRSPGLPASGWVRPLLWVPQPLCSPTTALTATNCTAWPPWARTGWQPP